MGKTFTKSATVAKIFEFPPELVWGEIIGHSTQEVAPLDTDTFENTEPRPGEMYTRLIEKVDNEIISMDMKSRISITRFTVELKKLDECRTRVAVTQNVTYNSFKWLAMSRFGANIRGEGMYYLNDLSKKLDALNDSLKRSKVKRRF